MRRIKNVPVLAGLAVAGLTAIVLQSALVGMAWIAAAVGFAFFATRDAAKVVLR